ncbi:MAG TPA: hypothetical protein VG167_11615 [Verrucomicrobiae bacterium]|nr:hypothetical protein [Verrucomicrobiae bacterium]
MNVFHDSSQVRRRPEAELCGAEFVTLEGTQFYRLPQYERLRPFLMTLVSPADHWLFLSSTGALTAGHRNPDHALFPYYTEDKLHDSADITGSKTLLRVDHGGRIRLWEPFSERQRGQYRLQRTLYKALRGNQVIFEERNETLKLVFRYGWFLSEQFGFVRKASLQSTGAHRLRVNLLDGVQNLVPSGIGSQFQLEKSVLLDAYKKNELIPQTGLGLFRLSSIPLDRPEPAEALRATTVWSVGFTHSRRLLCSRQLEAFRQGTALRQEVDIRAERGAYFLNAVFTLRPRQTRTWLLAADTDRSASDVAALNQWLRRPAHLRRAVEADIARGTTELEQLVAKGDGLQKTARPLGDARHYGNALFNLMRGGVFEHDYLINVADLEQFVRHGNRAVAQRHAPFFRKLRRIATAGAARALVGGARTSIGGARTLVRSHVESLSRLDNRGSLAIQKLLRTQVPAPVTANQAGPTLRQVMAMAIRAADPDLERFCREYLPLSFSRRHGDPSRPWNRFNIAPKNSDGSRSLQYEGNWRDIFQNWEALAFSFPAYASNMIARFVNASTPDGYNPYRLTRAGFDWEVPDPADPWSHIGYWGDHQVIYLLKLLELLRNHDPGALTTLLRREIFSYANVPYRIKPYPHLLANPKATVTFDTAAQALVTRRIQVIGADGKLVCDSQGRVHHVNLAEKLLVSLLAKFSNFIPGAGIWLNTQRPEWNDANNALVGNGASVVTLCYLRRYLVFCQDLFAEAGQEPCRISSEVVRLLRDISLALQRAPASSSTIESPAAARARRALLDQLGQAGSRYRERIYRRGFSGSQTQLAPHAVQRFLCAALKHVEATIRANRRPDGLYHAYNLVQFDKPDRIGLRRLYEMLEGQVAVLSSGLLSASESLDLLHALRRSALFRPDQRSYLLYPDRHLPRFLARNIIPPRAVSSSKLLRRLLAEGDTSLIERDIEGRCHFNGRLTNAGDLSLILDRLAGNGYAGLVSRESQRLFTLFETLFDHQSFTGRSGTFFGYEGLGCIYWHMISKLLLAVQETIVRCRSAGSEPAVAKSYKPPRSTRSRNIELLGQLAACYYDIRSGLGDAKTPAEYGAFPMDPYSHTPGQGGARQPGLTGQVKEDFLCRLGELGVFVQQGRIHFRPDLLRDAEFLTAPSEFHYYDLAGASQRLALRAGSLAFTYCQVPIIYQRVAQPALTILFADGSCRRQADLPLDAAISQAIFERTGAVKAMLVG